jgi:hypothetical protein
MFRGEKYIGFEISETHHRFIDVAGRQFAVHHCNLKLGHQCFQAPLHRPDILNSRTYEKALSTSATFPPQHPGYSRFLKRLNDGFHGDPADRRRCNSADRTKPGVNLTQGPRNGSCRHCQQMESFGQLGKFRLLGLAEPLLFVNDEQAEVVKAHALACESVSTDHDPQRSFCKPLLYGA